MTNTFVTNDNIVGQNLMNSATVAAAAIVPEWATRVSVHPSLLNPLSYLGNCKKEMKNEDMIE